MSSGKKSLGRQKIEMKMMSNKSNLQVTFSKRRSGLFKKACVLSTLCGVEVALVVFSPSEKIFSFGHPNVATIIDRYLSRAAPQNSGTMQFTCGNTKLTQINNALDIEKRFSDELSRIHKMIEAQFSWDFPVDGMNRVQLELFKKASEALKKLIAQRADRLVNQGTPTQTQPPFVGNSSSSNMPLHHQPNHLQFPMFSAPFFQNPTLQSHLFDFNNMRRGGGYGSPGLF